METLTFLMTSSLYPPYHIGGACVHVKSLAEELTLRGHEVHVVYSLDAYRIKRGFHSSIQIEKPSDIHVHKLESPINILDPMMVYTVGNSPYIGKKFSEIIEEVHPNVVHHHNITLLGYNILKKRNNYLSLYTAHDFWLICPTSNLLKYNDKVCLEKSCFSCAMISKRPPQVWRFFGSFKAAIEDIDLMISPCNYIRTRLAQEINVKSVTLPNFAPYPPETSPVKYSDYFLFVGMLEKHKGILNLLKLFKDFGNEINAKLVIAGEGSLKNYVRKFIESNSLGSLISYLGFVEHRKLYSFYKDALAVIVPSICPENAPLAALESFSVGTPVIASNKGGLPEIVEKVDKRLIFSDFGELGRILLNFRRKEFPAEQIKQIFKYNFSPETYIDRYNRIVKSILDR